VVDGTRLLRGSVLSLSTCSRSSKASVGSGYKRRSSIASVASGYRVSSHVRPAVADRVQFKNYLVVDSTHLRRGSSSSLST